MVNLAIPGFFFKLFQEYHLSVKQIGSRSGYCLQWLSADDTSRVHVQAYKIPHPCLASAEKGHSIIMVIVYYVLTKTNKCFFLSVLNGFLFYFVLFVVLSIVLCNVKK